MRTTIRPRFTALAKFAEWHWTAPGLTRTNPVDKFRAQCFEIGHWRNLDHYAFAIDMLTLVEG